MLKTPALESHGYTLLGTGKTVADWEAFEDTKSNLELIDGDLWMAPRPEEIHQRTQFKLLVFLGNWVIQRDLGLLYAPPVGLLMPSGDVYEPDVTFVEKSHPQFGKKWTKLTSPPALVVEIVSPGSRKRDWKTKSDGYAAMGVPNYWIIEPNDETFWAFRLVNGAWVDVAQTDSEYFEAPPFLDLRIPLASVFGL